ncbi:TDP-N-acetylfucosamine:lipid II N-acetylfucosaminyltransferase [Halomonas alkalicola]|uniref:TDP-N-acetylfucosamine:lipid II N-acetylfucosaminyltransferase n=1 Tax=Halomonas alkalicola TaxID=1930622 RepID=UPI00265E7BF0|nr:TDP-N-acetylfucosamine:lipid II N-acetylfucosaminyltransferase [Halomonas alkalicola]
MNGDGVILHVAGLDKFIPPFIGLVREEFKEEEHRFWLTGSLESYPTSQKDDVHVCGASIFSSVRDYAKLIWQLHAARKVMLHGLFNINVLLLLTLCPWVLSKCYWVIWGGDLYQYKSAKKSWRSRVKEPLRRFVIRRFGHLVTYIEGDVELARQWYGAKGVHHECLMYLSNVVDPSLIEAPLVKPQDGTTNILVGNSADPSNNHLEALERLLPYKDEDIKIYVPLSYGDQAHAESVIERGKAWFGEKLIPLTEFKPLDQYLEFLKTVDMAIFNHQRQQAMGNTITLLGMGKTVFMRTDVSQWSFLRNLGLEVHDVDSFSPRALEKEKRNKNSSIVGSFFSKDTLLKQYSEIFER